MDISSTDIEKLIDELTKENEYNITKDSFSIDRILFKNRFNNKYYTMSFTANKSKGGTEKYLLYNGITPKSNEEIVPKDLFTELRKRNNQSKNVIGTSLINVINGLPQLIPCLKMYQNIISSIKNSKIEDYLTNLIKIIKEDNISNIPNLATYINQVIDKRNEILTPSNAKELTDKDTQFNEVYEEAKKSANFLDQMNDTSESAIIKMIKEQSTDINFTKLCSFLEIALSNYENHKFLNYIYFTNFLPVLENLCLNPDDFFEDNLKYCYMQICEEVLQHMICEISGILGNNSFIIAIFIKNFQYWIKNLPKDFITFKNDIYNKALYTDTQNVYYKILYEYLQNNKDVKTFEYTDLYGLFICSLQVPLEELNDIVEGKYYNTQTLQLPKANIKFSEGKKILKPYEYIYKIENLHDFINVSLYHISLDNRKIVKCHNCSKYFITDIRNTEVYCKRIDPKDPKKRTCASIAKAMTRYDSSDDPRRRLYQNICNRLNPKRGIYPAEELEQFKEKYKNYEKEILIKYKNANYDKSLKNKKLLEWLEKYDKYLKKKYPSNRYNLKSKK